MKAQVISIDSMTHAAAIVERTTHDLKMFSKGIAIIRSLEKSTGGERRTAIENWLAAGGITEGERDELYAYYGWERP